MFFATCLECWSSLAIQRDNSLVVQHTLLLLAMPVKKRFQSDLVDSHTARCRMLAGRG